MKKRSILLMVAATAIGVIAQTPPPDGQGQGTAVTLTVGTTVIPATLNDTEAAKRLKAKLPLKISMSRSAVDYCGLMAGGIEYASKDLHNGWMNGDIVYIPNGNWLSIFYSGENTHAPNFLTLGRIDKEYLPVVAKLSGSIEMTIALAK